MKKSVSILFAAIALYSGVCSAAEPNPIHGYGNLHAFRLDDGSVRVVAAEADGGVLDTLIVDRAGDLRLRYTSAGEGASVSFDFPLHEDIDNPWRITPGELEALGGKTLAVSDFHGQLHALVAVLRGNGVVDGELNWTWGANRLIVLGDMLDRGRDDNGVAWLVYKLEKEARDAGGSVYLTAGNHEDLVLKNDLRYVNGENLAFAQRAAIPYADLYGAGSELGRWIRDKNLVLALGGNIFVHAGLSTEMSAGEYTPDEINRRARRWLGYANRERNAADARNAALFGTNGVLWYRGLVTDSAPISTDDLDTVLNYYGAGRIVVGHSVVGEVELRYDGRVIAINVDHAKNYKEHRSAGIIIEGDKIYSVDYHGGKTPLTGITSAPIDVDAVVVRGRIPAVSTSRGKTVVRVAGSMLQNLPEVSDILRRAPGLQVEDSGLTVFGKGTPQIYLDGRESSYEEIKLLQPQQILSIEVDSNPSARYDAQYSSVVRVRTNRARGGTSGQIANHAYQGRRFINSTAAQLQTATKRWVNFFSYNYTDQTTHNYVWDTEAIHLTGHRLADSIYSDDLSHSRQQSLLYGSTFDITPRHQLSWQYSGAFSKSDRSGWQQERIYQSDELQKMEADNETTSRRQSHSAVARYRFAIDSVRTLDVTTDWARSAPRSYETVSQHYLESKEKNLIAIDNISAADVFSAKAEYSTPLWGANLLLGARWGHIDSRTTSTYNAIATVTTLRNDNVATYATLGREYTKWGWEAGVRGEFLNDDIRTNDKTLREGWENNVFPSLNLYTRDLARNFDIALSYTSRIIRPSVNQLNPAASYVNSVVTGYGNPLLRSTVCHNFELGLTLWRNLTLTLGADYDINPSIEAGELDEDGDAIAFKPLNVPSSRTLLAEASYNNSWGPVTLTLDGGVEYPHAEIPYLGETTVVGRPSWYASIDTDVKLAKDTSLTAGFTYFSRGYDLMTVMEPGNNLTAGINQYLFDRRLQLSLSGYDLLRGGVGSGGNGWRDRYGFYEVSQRPSRDSRRVRLSVRWLFNNHKARYREQGRSAEFNRVN
jgi:hypothetical protein